MHEDQQKEQFSRAYVQAVAACAGFAWSVPSVDDDSIDMTLSQTGGRGTIRSPRLDVQIKCKAGCANGFWHGRAIPTENDFDAAAPLPIGITPRFSVRARPANDLRHFP